MAALAFHTGCFLADVTCVYADARLFFEHALKMRIELEKGEDSSSVARCYSRIGSVLNSQFKYDQALEYYQKDLEITVRVVGYENPDVAATLDNMSVVYDSQGKYDEALELYQKAEKVFVGV